MARLRDGLVALTEETGTATVRHLFYRAVSRGLVEKREGEYKATVCRLLTELRRSGRIPYRAIADNTRWILRSKTYRSRTEAMQHVAASYRRNLWDGAEVRVECWSEKDAIASLLSDTADEWNVPVMVFRGYSSVSYLHALAEEIDAVGRPTHILYFGDHDPSGVDIRRFVLKELRSHVPDAEIHFRHLAVTPEQIDALGLPTRPTKRSDPRAKRFAGESVEVDAVDPRALRDILTGSILQFLNLAEVERLRTIEEQEKATLLDFARQVEGFDRAAGGAA